MLTCTVASTYGDPVKISIVCLQWSASTLKPLTDEVDDTDRGYSTMFSWKNPGCLYSCWCSLTQTPTKHYSGQSKPLNASSATWITVLQTCNCFWFGYVPFWGQRVNLSSSSCPVCCSWAVFMACQHVMSCWGGDLCHRGMYLICKGVWADVSSGLHMKTRICGVPAEYAAVVRWSKVFILTVSGFNVMADGGTVHSTALEYILFFHILVCAWWIVSQGSGTGPVI